MKEKKPIALQPMLDALRIEGVVTLDQCSAMLKELQDATGSTVPAFQLSGNEWCALMNLALARFGAARAPMRLLMEHNGCGSGPQANQVTASLYPGDRVYLHMGRYNAAVHAAEERKKAGA